MGIPCVCSLLSDSKAKQACTSTFTIKIENVRGCHFASQYALHQKVKAETYCNTVGYLYLVCAIYNNVLYRSVVLTTVSYGWILD